MRRGVVLGVLLLACGCSRRTSAPTPHEASAAQDLTEQAFEDAEKAKIAASKALDKANDAQRDVEGAQRDVAKAQADLREAQGSDDELKGRQKLQQAEQKLANARANAQVLTSGAMEAQALARTADTRYQALSRRVQATVVRPRVPTKGDGASVLPGNLGPIQTVDGKVASVGNDRVVITTPNQTLTLQTDDLTQVNVDGRLVGLRRLPEGIEARVAYTPGPAPVARRIDATAVKARAAPPEHRPKF